MREFTHKERPWKIARAGLGEMERCANIIDEMEIKRYFKEMNEMFGLKNKQGVENYLKSLNVL